MLVTDDAKYGSRRSEVALAAMSKQESTSVTSKTKPSVIKESFDKKGQSKKAVRRRAYPIDAATCTALTRLLVPHPLSLMRKKVWRASEGSYR